MVTWHNWTTDTNVTFDTVHPVGWISVKDRLPEPNLSVLAFDAENVYEVAHFESDPYFGNEWWSDRKLEQVTHWMPLPEPPDEK